MKILITGSRGFIGKNLMWSLLNWPSSQVKGIEEEYFQEPDWKNYLRNKIDSFSPHAVFHVGACSDTLETDANYMMTRNYESTVVISDWCKDNSVPLVFSSSAANGGTDGHHPSNLYGWSKKAAEDYVIKNGQIALRYFNVYGPGEQHKENMASVAYQAYVKNKGKEEVKLFPGRPSRDFVYVDDVVSANLFALVHYETIGKQFYHVGSGESRTFEDVMDIMKIPYSYHEESKVPEGYQFYTASNPDMFLPGWEPNYGLEQGVSEYKSFLDKFFQSFSKL